MSLGNIIKSAIKTMLIADTETNVIPQMQVKLYDSIKNCGKLGMYGLYGNAPLNSFVILMQINGQEEVLFGIEDDVNNRPRALKEGEVMIMNTITRNYIYLKQDGSTEVYTKTNLDLNIAGSANITATENVNVTAKSAVFNCDVTINGTLKASVVEAGNGVDGTFTQSVTSAKGIVTAGS